MIILNSINYCIKRLEENKFLITGVVANGFDIEQREKLSKDFEKIKVDSDSIIVSGAKIPFTMVKPIHVVEIESTDIINSTSDGKLRHFIPVTKGEVSLLGFLRIFLTSANCC